MFRKAASENSIKNDFRLRGHEVRRIETFSDAVFAFAVTLLIVSLEVPKTFEELMAAMRGFIPFSISFLFLVLIWHEQNVFFRRYGLDNINVISLNCTLLFLVLFFVYPLKFLFTLIFTNSTNAITVDQSPILMTIYGAGFSLIYFLFFLMYREALNKSELLDLTSSEKFETRTKMYAHLIFVSIGLISIMLAWTLPFGQSGLAGFFYVIIGPVLTIYFGYRGKRKRMMMRKISLQEEAQKATATNDES